MSQDLLAAFGEAPDQFGKTETRNNNHTASFSLFDDLNGGSATSTNAASVPYATAKHVAYRDESSAQDNDDDDWGDFEGSTEIATQPVVQERAQPLNLPAATQFSRWLDEEEDGFKDYSQPTPRTKKWDFTKPELPAVIAQVKSLTRDPDVLFDVDNEPPDDDNADDDEFGDFEDAGGDANVDSPQQPSANAIQDLLGTDLMTESVPRSQPPIGGDSISQPPATGSLLDLEDMNIDDATTNPWNTSKPEAATHGFQTSGTLSKPDSPAKLTTKATRTERSKSFDQELSKPTTSVKQRTVLRKAHVPQPVATQEEEEEEEEEEEQWDEFEAWEQSTPAQASTTQASTTTIAIPPTLTSSESDSSISLPPTNIPPPALVLSLFAPLFASADTLFFSPARKTSPEVQQAIYTDPKAATYLKGLLALSTVCGRVIAGRKLRWKRDTILAQSMRIGPSTAGGVSGLKLTSLDKAEVAKEDREAADAVKAWQGTVGKLKSSIAKLHQISGTSIGQIPELKESIPVKVEGGLKGNRPCALCGLKREERVLRVDFEVEDSFGEWWVENVSMHRECRNFWEQHRDTLRSR